MSTPRGFPLALFPIKCYNPFVVIIMDDKNKEWAELSRAEKNHLLFLRQKALLDGFLERGAISRTQHDKSLRDLTEKMGESK